MNLLDSLLDAIVRLEGDALVMHVGEKPYVVTTSSPVTAQRGPLSWGQVELSSRVLTPDAVLGMLGQILPLEQRHALEDIGAVEYEIPPSEGTNERFSVVAARGGEDVWLEVRRRPKPEPVPEVVAAAPAAAPVETPALAEDARASSPEVQVPSAPAPELVIEAEEDPDAPEEEVFEISLDDANAVAQASAPASAPAIEIVPEVSQSAPTHAEVDALLASMVPPAAVQAAPVGARDVEMAVSLNDATELVPSSTMETEPPPVELVFASAPQAIETADAIVEIAMGLDTSADEPAPAEIVAAAQTEPAIEQPLAIVESPLVEGSAEPSFVEQPREAAAAPADEPQRVHAPHAVVDPVAVADARAVFEAFTLTAPEPVSHVPEEPEPVVASAFDDTLRGEGLPFDVEPVAEPAPLVSEPSDARFQAVADVEVASAVADAPAQPVAETPPLLASEAPAPAPLVSEPSDARFQAVADVEVASAVADAPAEPVAETPPLRTSEAPAPALAQSGDAPTSEAPAIEVPPIEPPAPALMETPLATAAEAAAPGIAEPIAASAADAAVAEAPAIETPARAAAEPDVAIAELDHPVAAETSVPHPEPAEAPVTVQPPARVETPAGVTSEAAAEDVRLSVEVVAAAPAAVRVPPQRRPSPAAPERSPIESPIAASLPPPLPAPEPVHDARPAAAVEESWPAVVVPISRSPVRPEIAVQAPAASLAPLEHMLRIAAARGASTVYVVAQSKPMIRVDGEISLLDSEPVFSMADVERVVMDLAPARGRDVHGGPVEWMSDVPEVGRVRCVTFRDHRGPGVIFRMIPPRAISADQLGLSPEVQSLCALPDGLVLVAGARASGKSTLLSAFVDLINRTRSDHVITVESQINFVHESRKSFVSQREVRGDAEAAAAAVRSAFREDPDVLVIEDLRTAEIVSVAIEAAESGRLVLGSLSAPSTVAAIERLAELFSPERRAQVQTALAGALRGVVAQVLLRKMKGGRIAAREVLLNTPAVATLILENRMFQLPVAVEAGRRHGMVPLNDSLAMLVRDGTVHVAEAYRKALDREALLAVLKRDGIDTSFAERLA